MATSKKISELTTATVLSGAELVPLVQSGETVQAQLSLLSALAPVQSVNGLTGPVILAAGDLAGYNSDIASIISSITAVSIRVDVVSAALTSTQALFGGVETAVSVVIDSVTSINTVITSVNTVITSINNATTSINNSITSVNNSITSVNTALTSINAAHTSVVDAITSINNAHTSVLTSRRPFAITFDFGVTTLPTSEYPKFLAAGFSIYVLPSCSNSQVAFNTSAFPATPVSIELMYPTSVALGSLVINVSGTVVWPAIATTSIAPGQTIGFRTSAAATNGLTGVVITLAGYYNP